MKKLISEEFKKSIIKVVTAILLVMPLIVTCISCMVQKDDIDNDLSNETVERKANYTEEDVKLLARLIYGESRGEPYEGQVAVGAVVLNRVESDEFPDTIEEVIFQKRQFSCVDDGQFYLDIPEDSSVYLAAREALEGKDPTNGCLYFYNPDISTSKWIFTLKTVVTIGNHRFAVEE